MSVLSPSSLETVDYGVQGWNAIVTSDMQRLNNKLGHLMSATKVPGTAALANNAATVTNPAAKTANALSNPDVGATFDQTTLNAILATIVTEFNKVVADLAESRTREQEYKTAIEGLKTSYNNLLAELRKSTGNGVLGG